MANNIETTTYLKRTPEMIAAIAQPIRKTIPKKFPAQCERLEHRQKTGERIAREILSNTNDAASAENKSFLPITQNAFLNGDSVNSATVRSPEEVKAVKKKLRSAAKAAEKENCALAIPDAKPILEFFADHTANTADEIERQERELHARFRVEYTPSLLVQTLRQIAGSIVSERIPTAGQAVSPKAMLLGVYDV
jgi:hypothetical protein